MPRTQNPGTTLRNRNRVTNKTRLKILKGNIDADTVVIEEDEERARVVSTAGVDAEDANEHHLQAVLSAASHRQQQTNATPKTTGRAQTGGAGGLLERTTAYIPTPDAAGLVEDSTVLYPDDRWRDPQIYLRFSDVVEECYTGALANGFSYVLDERDLIWLSKNNKDARGEGTSTQLLSLGTITRSNRSSKVKGKEPDVVHPTCLSEDEFELVMGLFEKITFDKSPFLHVHFDVSSIPTLPDFEPILGSAPPSTFFADYVTPPDIPPPARMLQLARVIYPHWRERRTERQGARIIPQLNIDDSNENDSYVCFRRRDIKPVRKTRATNTFASEKLARLKAELDSSLKLAQSVVTREKMKANMVEESNNVWQARRKLVDLKRRHPSIDTKDDLDILVDKDKPKRPKHEPSIIILPSKTRATGEPTSATPSTVLRPKERYSAIMADIDRQISRQKETDRHWEDQLDEPYLSLPEPARGRFTRAGAQHRRSTAFRMRVGRGGRRHIDRRLARSYGFNDAAWLALPSRGRQNADEDHDAETAQRISERWRFDESNSFCDVPPEEDNRFLLDDYQTKYLVCNIGLLKEADMLLLDRDYRSQAAQEALRAAYFKRPTYPPAPYNLPSQPTTLANGSSVPVPRLNASPPSVQVPPMQNGSSSQITADTVPNGVEKGVTNGTENSSTIMATSGEPKPLSNQSSVPAIVDQNAVRTMIARKTAMQNQVSVPALNGVPHAMSSIMPYGTTQMPNAYAQQQLLAYKASLPPNVIPTSQGGQVMIRPTKTMPYPQGSPALQGGLTTANLNLKLPANRLQQLQQSNRHVVNGADTPNGFAVPSQMNGTSVSPARPSSANGMLGPLQHPRASTASYGTPIRGSAGSPIPTRHPSSSPHPSSPSRTQQQPIAPPT